MSPFLTASPLPRLLRLASHGLPLLLAGVLGAARAEAQCPPDVFEPNDLCSQAVTIGAGSFLGLTQTASAPDFYRVIVPAGHRIEVRLHLPNPDPQLLATLGMFRDDGSASPCDQFSNSVGLVLIEGLPSDHLLAWSAPASAAAAFIIAIDAFAAACLPYDLDVALLPDPCAAQTDAFEGNDDCASAAPLGAGSFGNLNVGIQDPDFYAVVAAPGELLSVALSGLAPGEVAMLFAWDAGTACGVPNSHVSAASTSGQSSGGMYLFNPSATARTFVVEVRPQPSQATQIGFCFDYALNVSAELDPCGAVVGDPFEPNTDCGSAPALAASQTGLSIHSWQDFDYYSVDVAARSTLRLLTTSQTVTTPRPMTLLAGCGAWGQEFLMSSHPVYFSGLDQRHWLQWSNTTDAATNTRLFVHTPFVFPAPFCELYDLQFEVTLGVPFCNLSVNSTGEAARMSASGSTSVGQGTLELSAIQLPPSATGLIVFSPSSHASTPLGNGYFCLNSFSRLPVTQAVNGTLHTSVDWTGSAALITSGSTFSFQTWFRDPSAGGAFFNLSEGLRLEFQ